MGAPLRWIVARNPFAGKAAGKRLLRVSDWPDLPSLQVLSFKNEWP
jgi:hypothetical protein